MNKLTYVLLVSLPLWYACSGEENEDVNQVEVETEDKETNSISFNIPSPSEQFEIISNLDGVKNLTLVNDYNKANSYEGSASKALNFGVYIADVAYLTSFKETSKYLSYFSKIEKLGNDLGVSQVFTKELGDGAKKWEGNADSLFKLSDQTYTKTFQKLVDIEKGNELSLMLAGGWIESMHLILGTSKGFSKSPQIDRILVDQKLVAENLIDFMLDYQDNADVKTYIDKIGMILDIYQGLDCTSGETKISKSGNKVSLSGGDECKLNEKTFAKLKEEVTKLRSEIVK
ncbi:MAG: hypothetical protein K0R65_2933 [Crocinitomicaceae bacterium]|nr:hypothetical protein [Crocinitomicaceae bacterium]